MKRAAVIDALMFLAPFGLYAATMTPTIQLGDSGELTLGAALLAIPHVPGYPLLATLGRAAMQTPLAHLAWRGNFFSALCGGAAVWAAYRLLVALTGRRAASAAAALVFAASFTLWEQSLSIRAYPLNTFFAAVVLLLSLRWRQTFDPRWLWSAALAFGLGLGNHEILLVTAFPALVWMVAHRRRWRWRDAWGSAVFAGVGLSIYLYLPVRAAAGPALNWGDPSNLPRLLDVLLQKQYANKMLSAAWDPKIAVLKIIATSFVDEIGPAAFVFSALGWAALARRDAPLMLGLLLLILANMLLRINYIGPDETFQVKRYMISSYLAAIVGLGVFLDECQRRAAAASRRLGRAAFAAVAALLVAWPAFAHFHGNEQSRNWIGYESAQNVLSHPEPVYALIAGGDNSVFPLWYLQLGERRRPAVVILPYEGFYAPWIVTMMQGQLPPDVISPDSRFARPGLRNPLFLAAVAHLVDRADLPVGATFETIGDPPMDEAFAALRLRGAAPALGAVCWLRNDRPASDVWRFYETAAICDPKLARDHHTQAVAVKYAVYFDRRGRALAAAGQTSAALDAYGDARASDPDNDAVLANLGSLLARLGRYDDAVAVYRQALEFAPGEKRLRRNLAVILEAAGRAGEAARERQLAGD